MQQSQSKAAFGKSNRRTSLDCVTLKEVRSSGFFVGKCLVILP